MTIRLPRLSDCRDCADPIRFVVLNNNSILPVNPVPSDTTGNVCARVVGLRLHGYVISAERPPSTAFPLRFTPHHATCSERPAPKPKPPEVEPDPALF